MKHTLVGFLAFFILLFAYTKLAGPIPFSVTSVTTQKTDSFSVTGEGKVTIIPDIANVSLGVSANGTTVKQVQEDMNRRINAVSAAVKALGVAEKDIQTSNYSVSPDYDGSGPRQRITGYNANSTLTIKIRDIEKINAVIDAAAGAGANQIGGISFDVDDKTKAQNEAREKAVAEAKRKASDAARIAGFSLGKIINYSEDFGGYPGPLYAADRLPLAGGGEAKTNVEPGSTEVRVTVTLSFELK